MLTTGIRQSSWEALNATDVTRAQSGDTKADRVVSSSGKESDGVKATISGLAQLLAESAADMDNAYRSMSRAQLADLAKSFHDDFALDANPAVRELRDAEVPKSDDAEVVALAAKSTAFVRDARMGGHGVSNPFAGLSREQLDNIIYDDSKRFTFNERVAAYYEVSGREEKWRQRTCALGMAEYDSTGKMTGFFKSCLEQFNQLPQIEQVQYPADYAIDLQNKIKLNFNYREHRAERNGDDEPMSLIEMLLKNMPRLEQKARDEPRDQAIQSAKPPISSAIDRPG